MGNFGAPFVHGHQAMGDEDVEHLLVDRRGDQLVERSAAPHVLPILAELGQPQERRPERVALIRRELVDGTSRWATTGIVVDWADWDRLHRDAGEMPTKHEQQLGWEQWLRADPEGTGEQVGYVTSFCYSPVLQRHIGLARVRPGLAEPGTVLHMETTLHHGTHMVAVATAPLPFFNPARKTATP